MIQTESKQAFENLAGESADNQSSVTGARRNPNDHRQRRPKLDEASAETQAAPYRCGSRSQLEKRHHVKAGRPRESHGSRYQRSQGPGCWCANGNAHCGVIGAGGSTGNSTGPHLYFEVRKGSPDREVLDPVAFLEGAEYVTASAPTSGYSAVSDSRGSLMEGGYSSSLGLPSDGSGSARAAGPSIGSGQVGSPGFSGSLSGISSGGVDGMWAQLAQYGITEDWLRKLLEELGVPESEMKQMMALGLGSTPAIPRITCGAG